MADPQQRISDETRQADRRDARAAHGASETPTPEENEAAERYGEAASETKDEYTEALERGADQQGEGRIP